MFKQVKVNSSIKILWPVYVFYFSLIYFVRNNSFFWDKDIIYSVLAKGILQHGNGFIFENSSDIGYFAGLAYLLAGSWKLFGMSLPVMHWLMLPASLGVVYETFKFLKKNIPQNYLLLALIIVLIDPSLMAQSVMYSTDLFQVYFFLAAINAILNNKRWVLSLCLFASVLVHGRGVITVASLFFIEIAYLIIDKKITKDNWFIALFNKSLSYIPAVIFTLTYLIVHYIKTGWIGYHEESPWAGCFEKVDLIGFLRNSIIITWRIIDFGRIILYLILIIILLSIKRNKDAFLDNNGKKILATGLIFLGFNLPSMLVHKNLSDHRYIIVYFVFASAFVCYLLYNKINSRRLRIILSCILVIGLGTGNFWIYPDKIAQGWSGTLAHLPFYKQRVEMIKFIETENIPYNEIGSDTPNIQTMDILFLNGENKSFHRKNLGLDKYVYYSNIINVFSDAELDELKNYWTPIKTIKKFGVKTILYKKPNPKTDIKTENY